MAGGWRTIATVSLGATGAYSTSVPASGRYRIEYGCLGGPAVTGG